MVWHFKAHETLNKPQVEAKTKLGFNLGQTTRATKFMHRIGVNSYEGC